MKEVLEFLEDLNLHNNREWFNANKARYEAARKKMLFLTELFTNEIRKFDNDLPAMNPNDALFRIYRDIRFSPDKRPYKTHFGSYMAKGGHKSTRAGYYIHIQPDESFISGGIWMPSSDVLKALRTAIYDQADEFVSILKDPEFAEYFDKFDGEVLKKAPKGFPPDFRYIELLKNKSFAVTSPLTRQDLRSDKFVDHVMDAFRQFHKLNRFLNMALDQYI